MPWVSLPDGVWSLKVICSSTLQPQSYGFIHAPLPPQPSTPQDPNPGLSAAATNSRGSKPPRLPSTQKTAHIRSRYQADRPTGCCSASLNTSSAAYFEVLLLATVTLSTGVSGKINKSCKVSLINYHGSISMSPSTGAGFIY